MKEKLLRIKKLLERKCFRIDECGESNSEYYLDVVKKIDNEGAAMYLCDSFENLANYCKTNKIEFSDLSIYVRMMLMYDEKYEDRFDYIMEKKIKPVDDIMMIYISGVSHTIYDQEQTEDDSLIVDNKDFYVTFDELKNILSEYDLNIEFESFEEIKNKFLSKKPMVTKITQSKTKKKIKTK